MRQAWPQKIIKDILKRGATPAFCVYGKTEGKESMKQIVSKEIAGKTIVLETGRMAKQSAGSVLATCGGTVVLATVNVSDQPREGQDFFPLTVDYIEKMYASGKVPGGFFKRESRPTTKATLTARLIDRPIRPLFPEGFRNDVHVVITVLSYDEVAMPDWLGGVAACAALSISKIPFAGPAASVVVGMNDDGFILNPSLEEQETSLLDLAIAGTKNAVTMVEAGAKEITEQQMLDAIEFGHEKIQEFCSLIDELVAVAGDDKVDVKLDVIPEEIMSWVDSSFLSELEAAIRTDGKMERYEAIDVLKEKVLEAAEEKYGEDFDARAIGKAYDNLEKKIFRAIITKEHIRADRRPLDKIRQLTSEVGVLPQPHGSALFTRGETQSLAVTTLGTSMDEQTVDGLDASTSKRFYLHYNFPPFSVGETGFMRGPGRRELGHGALAERALEPVVPAATDFPYTIRLVSEILESNGSSSMASVCAGCMSMMEAGVPVKAPVAGIAMGLIKEDEDFVILTDIMGMEDHLGDMDFKVCGTKDGITALQMDIKILGVTKEIMTQSLDQAKDARMQILDHMNETIAAPSAELAENAPRLVSFSIESDKVGTVIGPGGKMIRAITEESGARIEINDDNIVTISATKGESLNKAKEMIMALVKDVEVGEIYEAKVVRIVAFGAFVELLPGKDGLVHISQICDRRLESVEEELSVGDMIKVKVKEIKDGKISLTMKNI